MAKYFILFVLTILLFPLQSQKNFTLEEAVLGQYRQFYPEYTFGFEWIPNSNEFSFLNKFVFLKTSTINGEQKEIASIAEVNSSLGSSLRYFQNLTWKTKDEFYLMDEKGIYRYNWKTKTGSKRMFSPNSDNHELHSNSGRVAYTFQNNIQIVDEKGKIIYVTTNSDKNIVSGQAIARSEMGIKKGLFWSPNAQYLAFYEKNETNVANYPLLDITETPGKLREIKYPMAGQGSEKPRVGIYNVKKKKTVFITPRGKSDDYLTNLSWSPDEQFILLAEVSRSQKSYELNIYNAANGKYINTIWKESRNTWVEPKHGAHFLNNEEFVWVSEKDGFDNIYLVTIKTGESIQLTKHNFVVNEITHVTDNEVFYTATGDNPLDKKLFKVSKDKEYVCITHEKGIHQTIVHPSGKYIWNEFTSEENPRIERVISSNGEVLLDFVNAKDPLEDYNLGKTIVNKISSDDNQDLWYRMILPTDFDSTKQYPVLIYVYGGPHAQLVNNAWLNGTSLWMHWMAQQGYVVFTLDNRGSANRGVAFEHGIHRQLGTLELSDQLKGVSFLKSKSFIDAERIAVHGWSFGGFMTGTMLLKEPDLFKVGVAGGPVTDWKFYEVMYGERYMDTPEENPEGYENASLLGLTKNLKGNLLLIHGTIDDVVVMQHNYALVKSFVDNGIQVDFFPYLMHPHNVSGKDRVHLMTKVLHYILEKNQ